MKGYDYLKKALDGDIEYKTIIMTKNLYEDEWHNYDYYIYEKDRMFHRCNSEGKLGMKYQDRFLNYKVLEKDFEFCCVLEEKNKIPEKLEEPRYNKGRYYIKDINGDDSEISGIERTFRLKINEIIDTLEMLNDKIK